MISKTDKEKIFKLFTGDDRIHILMDFLDNNQLHLARGITEEEIVKELDRLVKSLDEFTYPLHNKIVSRIIELREADTIITDEILLQTPEEKSIKLDEVVKT